MTEQIESDSHTIRITHPDKVMFPGDGITKRDLVDYYRSISLLMIPHVRERPLTMERYMDGIDSPGFYQKEAPGYFPDWIKRVKFKLKEEGREQTQVLCNDEATLLYITNQGCITHHIWLSRADMLDYPDKLIYDLDPPGDDFDSVKLVARFVKKELEKIGFTPYAMTTGSSGMHVVVPLDRKVDFEGTREFARSFAESLADSHSDLLTTEVRKDKRGDRIFLDYLRNSYGQTGIAPYTVRAKPGAPVATPVGWGELEDVYTSRQFNINNIFKRIEKKGDPWKDFWKSPGSVGVAIKKLS